MKRLLTQVICALLSTTGLYCEDSTPPPLSALPSADLSLNPYYTYSESEILPLKKLTTTLKITSEDLQKWDAVLQDLFTKSPLPEANNYRLYAYVYTAQRDAAALALLTQNGLKGSLDSLTYKLIQLFYPHFTPSFKIVEDDFSAALTETVFSKYAARFEDEQKDINKKIHLLSLNYWTGYQPTYGQTIRQWQPWQIPTTISPASLSSPPPDDVSWKEQLNIVKQAHGNVNQKQEVAALYWSQMNGKQGNWISITNEYLIDQKVPLPKSFRVRSILAMGICDALIAVYEAKFTYKIPPPYVKDPAISPLSFDPRHPSYPSSHAAVATTASSILTYFFPENQKMWEQLAQEASDSRLWNGSNYPIDNAAGQDIGKKIQSFYTSKNEANKNS